MWGVCVEALVCSHAPLFVLFTVVGPAIVLFLLGCRVVLFVGCRIFNVDGRFVFVGLQLCYFLFCGCSEIR